MKNSNRLIILIALIYYSLLLVSCNKGSDSEEKLIVDNNIIKIAVEEENKSLVDVVSDIVTSPDSISVFVGNTSFKFNGGRVYAKADKQQMNRILDVITTIEFGSFIECDDISTDALGEAFNLSLVKNGDIYHFDLEIKGDRTYTILTKWPSEIDGNVPISAKRIAILYGEPLLSSEVSILKEIILLIMLDTEDEENCATITVNKDFDTNFPTIGTVYNVKKSSSAIIENILDGTISTNNYFESDNESEYDLEIHLGNNVYYLNTKTGVFTRNNDGRYLLEKSWLKRLMLLHLKN